MSNQLNVTFSSGLKDYMEERITAIIGAGAPLNFSYTGKIIPSTGEITRIVTTPYLSQDGKNNIIIPKQIETHLKKTYPPERNGQTANINFEMIFHVMELYISYENSWNNKRNRKVFPIFGPFTLPSISFDLNDMFYVMKQYIIRIMDIVDSYNVHFMNVPEAEMWYKNFFRASLHKWDIFNFNYDTTIEASLGEYEDGYTPIRSGVERFSPIKLWNNAQTLSTVNHLHGCINYCYSNNPGRDRFNYRYNDLFKYDSYDTVKQIMNERYQSHSYNQDGTVIFAGPILTGLRKTDKLNCVPFDFYHSNLTNCIIRNRSLLIVGYSFGDLYCNQMIERMVEIHGNKSRVVIIDKWFIKNYDEDSLITYMKEKISLEMSNFLKKVVCVDQITALAKQLKFNNISNPMRSNNGNLMLLIDGFKKATDYKEEIMQFLLGR